MKQQVAIQTIRITKKGEARYFTVRLPKDVKRIIGLETGIRHITPEQKEVKIPANADWLTVPGSTSMGTLKLQSTDRTNVFYTSQITDTDYSLPQGDYSFNHYTVNYQDPNGQVDIPGRDYVNPVRFWKPEAWTHNTPAEEEAVLIEPSPAVINGLYTDEYGRAKQQDIEYMVSVYIWYEATDCKNFSK